MRGGLVWALSAVYANRLRAAVELDLLALTARQMPLGSLVVTAVAPLVPSPPVEPTAHFWGALAYCSAAATAIAWLLWLYLLHGLPANLAGLASLCVPVVGVLAAWLDLDERPRRRRADRHAADLRRAVVACVDGVPERPWRRAGLMRPLDAQHGRPRDTKRLTWLTPRGPKLC